MRDNVALAIFALGFVYIKKCIEMHSRLPRNNNKHFFLQFNSDIQNFTASLSLQKAFNITYIYVLNFIHIVTKIYRI